MVDVERLSRTLARIRDDVQTIRSVASSRDLDHDEVALAEPAAGEREPALGGQR